MVFSIPPSITEYLFLSNARTVVVRESTKLPPYVTPMRNVKREDLLVTLKPEDLLESDARNFALSNLDIREVALIKRGIIFAPGKPAGPRLSKHLTDYRTIYDLHIKTDKKDFNWVDLTIPGNEQRRTSKCDDLLQRVFGEKLSVENEYAGRVHTYWRTKQEASQGDASD